MWVGAGWGVVIFRHPIETHVPDFVIHGPVVIEPWDHRYLGAHELTNNTSETTAIAEAMIWLRDEAPDDGKIQVTLKYDSQYAANMGRELTEPKCNTELVTRTAELVREVGEKRNITWEHVYGHSGEHGNDCADTAAKKGAKGSVSGQSVRWTAAAPRLPGKTEDGIALDTCRKCGKVMPFKEIRWHVRHCQGTGVEGRTPNLDKCRKCGMELALGHRTPHEGRCRGSWETNHTCTECGCIFPDAPLQWIVVHENECKRKSSIRARAETFQDKRAKAKAKAAAAHQCSKFGSCETCHLPMENKLSRHAGCRVICKYCGEKLSSRTALSTRKLVSCSANARTQAEEEGSTPQARRRFGCWR